MPEMEWVNPDKIKEGDVVWRYDFPAKRYMKGVVIEINRIPNQQNLYYVNWFSYMAAWCYGGSLLTKIPDWVGEDLIS